MTRDNDPRCRRYSDTTYSIPFGVYSTGDAEPPANEVLVGRVGHRAYLIDLLINTGRRAAFLVTGRRGSGKTTFVTRCLHEYESSVFKRFLNSHVGRGLLDRVGLILLWSVIFSSAFLGLLQLMRFLGAWTKNVEDPFTLFLVWLAMSLVATLCIYPILYARELFEAIAPEDVVRDVGKVLDRFFPISRSQSPNPMTPAAPIEGASGFIASLFVIAVAVLGWYIGPFGSLYLGTSRLLAVLAGFFLLVELTSFKHRADDGESWDLKPWHRWLPFAFLAVAGVFLALGWTFAGLEIEMEDEYWLNLITGIGMVSLAFFCRFLYHDSWVSTGTSQESPAQVMRSSGRWYLVVAVLGYSVSILVFVWNRPGAKLDWVRLFWNRLSRIKMRAASRSVI